MHKYANKTCERIRKEKGRGMYMRYSDVIAQRSSDTADLYNHYKSQFWEYVLSHNGSLATGLAV